MMKFLLIALFATAASAMIAPLHTSEDRIEGEYIVVFKDGFDVEQSITTIRNTPYFASMGGKINRVYKSALPGFAGSLTPKALGLVRRFNFVKYVQEDHMMYPAAVASWGLDRIDHRNLSAMDNTYSPHHNGTGVNVYVIDSGIRTSHVDFGGRAHTNSSIDFVSGGNNGGIDCNGHGSHCAGTVGGVTYGVATHVNIYGVRVTGCTGVGPSSALIQGVEWVTANRKLPAVASISYIGSADSTIDEAVHNLHEAGVIVVVSAGNDNNNVSNYSPARESHVITVGATDNTDSRASFSNWGVGVDIFAPGVNIVSTSDESNTAEATKSGTSFATAHAAGGAAIFWAENTTLTADQVTHHMIDEEATVNVIKTTSLPEGTPNKLLFVGEHDHDHDEHNHEHDDDHDHDDH